MTRPPTPVSHAQLDRYLGVLAGDHPAGRWLEIRYATGAGAMRQRFIAADQVVAAARVISQRAGRSDVYCGVALRDRRAGGRDAVGCSHLLFVEIDAPDAGGRLEQYPCLPTMLIASGSRGHLHAYWQLRTPIGVDELEAANRRLAYALGGDLASVDAARILRPPASWNHKHTPPAAVKLLALDPSRRYQLDELTGGLEHPPAAPRPHTATARRGAFRAVDRVLLAIPASDYTRALAGLEPNRAGKVCCPFHPDENPSLQLYADNSFYCFGCGAGGSIYDFAARLYRLETKGAAFIKLRERILEGLGLKLARHVRASARISSR